VKCSAGHENPPSATFCMTCGARLEEASTPAAQESLPSQAAPSSNPARRGSTRTRTLVLASLLGALLVAALVVVVALTLQGSDDDSTASDDPTEEPAPVLQAVYDDCSAGKGGKTLSVGDEGYTLVIDTGSEYGPVEGLACVLAGLETSEAVTAQMGNTTSMMGVQEANDGDLHYQFSYHPDNGMNVVITDNSSE
jgi:hypothetical protein